MCFLIYTGKCIKIEKFISLELNRHEFFIGKSIEEEYHINNLHMFRPRIREQPKEPQQEPEPGETRMRR